MTHSLQWSHWMRRFVLLALPLAVCLLFLFPGISEAHAILLRSDPARDAVLNTAPSQVRMWFSEDLNPTFSTAVVVNGSNQRVDVKNAHVAPGDRREMDVSLQSNLPPSVYVVVWRTQSADDGHVLRGSFIFSVAAPDGTVPKLGSGIVPGQDALGGANATSGLSTGQLDGPTLFSLIAITLVELGVVFWVGAQLWQTFVLQLIQPENEEQRAIYQHTEQRFAHRLSLPALLVILLANVGVLIGQGLSLTGGRWDQVFDPSLLTGLITGSQFGTFWIMREVVVMLAILLALYTLYAKKIPSFIKENIAWANLILGLALLIAMVFSGHAAAVNSDIVIYAILVDWLHLLAAALWIGGMMFIATSYLPALKGSSLMERTSSLLTTVSHFSPLAITGVLIMAISGPFNATTHMNSWDQLVTTAYGRTLIVKVLLVGCLLLTSAIHVGLFRPRLAKDYKKYSGEIGESKNTPDETSQSSSTGQEVKALEGRIGQQMQRYTNVLRWEPLLGAAVLICTGLLNVFAGTLLPAAPSQAQAPTQTVKPYTTTVQTTDHKFTVNLTVSPNRFGPNVFTVGVLDSSGKPDTNIGVSLYTTMLDMDMGTTPVNLQPDGKGHFSANGDLDMGGHWQIRVQIRTPDNTLHETKVDFTTPY